MIETCKIIIVDDHELFRDGLKFFLAQTEGMEVIDEASNGIEFLSMLEIYEPDIVLMDISMPEMDGIQATKEALQVKPGLKIITLSSYGDEVYYHKMIEAGVMGFVLKDAGKNEIGDAIKHVMAGHNYFSRELLQKIMFRKQESPVPASAPIKISKREKEVLRLICQGHSNNEIADKLYISPKTVNNHRTNLLSKTDTKNSANLVMYAIKNKLIEI